jgi:hypothetical protein
MKPRGDPVPLRRALQDNYLLMNPASDYHQGEFVLLRSAKFARSVDSHDTASAPEAFSSRNGRSAKDQRHIPNTVMLLVVHGHSTTNCDCS